MALIGGLDVPLAPIWVWIAFGETPGVVTVAGGLIVVLAAILNPVLSTRGQPARPPRPRLDTP